MTVVPTTEGHVRSIPGFSDFYKGYEKEGALVGALVGGRLVGCGEFIVRGKVGWCKTDFVDERCRGRGIHTRLVEARIRMGRNMGVSKIRATCVYASLGNYKRLGFKTVKEYKHGELVELEL